MTPLYLNRQFANKEALHHFLKDNAEAILEAKKTTVHKSIDKGASIGFVDLGSSLNTDVYKASLDGLSQDNIYPVVSSTNWLDSHFDVHLKGCFKKTVKEQQGKVYLIDTHLKGLSNIIARKADVRMFVKSIPFRVLGKDFEGESECLVFSIPKLKVRPDALEFIKETPDLENSLAMRYVNISLAVNSKDPAYEEEREEYEKYINQIANRDLAEKYGFFYAVKELAIMGEGSICPVVGGSNSATRVLIAEKSEEIEPPVGTQEQPTGVTEEKSDEVSDEELTKILNKLKKLENV